MVIAAVVATKKEDYTYHDPHLQHPVPGRLVAEVRAVLSHLVDD